MKRRPLCSLPSKPVLMTSCLALKLRPHPADLRGNCCSRTTRAFIDFEISLGYFLSTLPQRCWFIERSILH